MPESSTPAPVAWEDSSRPPRAWQAEAFPIILDAMKRRKKGVVSAVMGSGKSVLQAEVARRAMWSADGRAVVVTAPRQALVQQLSATIRERCGEEAVGAWWAEEKDAEKPVVVCCGASLPSLHDEFTRTGRKTWTMIIDECHGSEGNRIKEIVPEMDPTCLLGFTATPFRSCKAESLSLFDEVIYRYSMGDALRDGVLTPMRHVRFKGTDPGTEDEECLNMMREDGQGPGIVSAYTIEDAEQYAAWLTGQGFPALAIHSRQPKAERAGLLQQLREGAVRCLVHVALLSEGVDFPWLRWICLRRKVGSGVRFLQEMGRVLRVDPGSDKTEGVIMDPHLLLGKFGITTVEAIGKALEEAAAAEEREAPIDGDGTKERRREEVVAMDSLMAYVEAAHAAYVKAGIIVVDPRWAGNVGWRMIGVSEKQVAQLKRAAWSARNLPGPLSNAILALSNIPWALTRGNVSDILGITFAAFRQAKDFSESHGMPKWYYKLPDLVEAEPPKASDIKIVKQMEQEGGEE